jgi:hypothetical protein
VGVHEGLVNSAAHRFPSSIADAKQFGGRITAHFQTVLRWNRVIFIKLAGFSRIAIGDYGELTR